MAEVNSYDTARSRALKSVDPVGNWIGSLTTNQLVELWSFLGADLPRSVICSEIDQMKIRETASKSTANFIRVASPPHTYVCKDRGGLRPSERHKAAMGVGLYKHRSGDATHIKPAAQAILSDAPALGSKPLPF